mmetsp:Transcript_8568/g.25760  ORF Transcript_8568/g.25760 Transcript_8568/m.25760 type:complete len:219 (+) Transcript_8568:75-731(+)
MAYLYQQAEDVLTRYKDRRFGGSQDERQKKLAVSTTLYVGNLSFYTSEEQIWMAFSRCGEVKRIIMGLNQHTKTPCGFCFVEYFTREDAQNAIWHINGLKVDERYIRVDWDTGFEPGRQYGRGRSGGQVRDEMRTDYDAGRGGYGKAAQPEVTGQNGMELWGDTTEDTHEARNEPRNEPRNDGYRDRKRTRPYDDDRGSDRNGRRQYRRDYRYERGHR